MLQHVSRTKSTVTERREAAHQQGRKAAEAGFTLIELLIVIVILGILAAVVVFSVSGITDRGKTAACDASTTTINTAAEAFYAQNNANLYPKVMTDLVPKFLHSDPTNVTVTFDPNGATAPTVSCNS